MLRAVPRGKHSHDRMMDRRAFVLVCAMGALSVPLAAGAQQVAGKVYRLGILSAGGVPDPSIPTMANVLPSALRDFGYVEGRNLVVDRRFAEDRFDRLPGLARELVQLRPDAIVAVSGQAIQAARDATATIPIVMVISRPGGERVVHTRVSGRGGREPGNAR